MSEAEREKSEQSRADETLLPELSLDSLNDVVASRRGFLTFLAACSAALFLATVPFARRFVGSREEHFPKVALGRVTDMPLGESRPFVLSGEGQPCSAHPSAERGVAGLSKEPARISRASFIGMRHRRD